VTAAYASSAAAGVATTVANVVVNKPTGVASGDLLVALAWANNVTATWAAPAGWTKIAEDLTNASMALFTRVADGSEGSTFTFTRAVNTVNGAGVTVARITGAGTVAASGLGFSATNTIVLPSVNAAGANTLLFQMVSRVAGASSWTAPGGTTERYDFDSSGTANTTAGGDQIVGAGATGTRTWTMAATANSRGAILAINDGATPSGAVSGTYDFSGSAAGQQVPNEGSTSGAYDFSGSAAGQQAPNEGSTSGTYDFSGESIGEQPPNEGEVFGEYDFSGAGQGMQPGGVPNGSVSGVYDFSGLATGQTPSNPGAGWPLFKARGSTATLRRRRRWY
jgi:hypothetical protein